MPGSIKQDWRGETIGFTEYFIPPSILLMPTKHFLVVFTPSSFM